MANTTLAHIYRYPVKGLSGERLEKTRLHAGGIIPQDRRYGIVHASSSVDAQQPVWASKKHFLNLARDEKLGELSAEFTDNGQKLSILRKKREIVKGDLSTAQGRMVIEGFLSSFMPAGARGHARLVDAGVMHFADNEENYLSLINLSTLLDIERVVRAPVDHRRFRGNLYLEGAKPWQERQWLGKKVAIGEVVFAVVDHIERCNAVNMNPDSGEIDLNIPLSLRRGFRHADCGVFLRVIQGGEIVQGMQIEVIDNG